VSTSLTTRMEILRDLYTDYRYSGDWEGFIEQNDLAIPLALSVVNGMATPTPQGEEAVSATWNALCSRLGVDPSGDYPTLESLIGREYDDLVD